MTTGIWRRFCHARLRSQANSDCETQANALYIATRKKDMTTEEADVVVIGAGPAGSAASVGLAQRGHKVVCLERGHFPRQVVGESLLPRCNDLLAELGLLEAVQKRGYMVKAGALFLRGQREERFAFGAGLPGDRASSFQVPRDDFDQTLATCARRRGVQVRFGHEVQEVAIGASGATLKVHDQWRDKTFAVNARFILDCSGYGRVLARCLKLDQPTGLPNRVACFTHFEGDRRDVGEHEGDIWVCCHPDNGWMWIIPFSNGRTSVGMVCDPEHWDSLPGTPVQKLQTQMWRDENAMRRLSHAEPVLPPQVIREYSTKNVSLHGNRWAVAGNAGDFLDPVFSSGVTLALESASLAASLVHLELQDQEVDWQRLYAAPMNQAVAVFRALVQGWYSGQLPDIFFAENKLPRVKIQITSLLGGYVLRSDNPLTADCARSLATLHEHISRGA